MLESFHTGNISEAWTRCCRMEVDSRTSSSSQPNQYRPGVYLLAFSTLQILLSSYPPLTSNLLPCPAEPEPGPEQQRELLQGYQVERKILPS